MTCYFGVPGVGKTTLAAKFARLELRRIKQHRSKYKRVYTNFYCKGCYRITYQDLKEYKLYDSLLIFDELTLDADNRKFKEFSNEHRDFFILHRHLGLDIIYLTQDYSKVDSKIRALTQELWYMQKSVLPIFRNFTRAKRIYRNIAINEYSGELINGYRFCTFLEAFFVSNIKICWRRRWYKYFDSFDESVLESRPVFESIPWTNDKELDSFLSRNFKKIKFRSNILIRKGFRKIKKVKKTWNSGT